MLTRYLGWAEAAGAETDNLLGAPATAPELVNRALDEQSDAESAEGQVTRDIRGLRLGDYLDALEPDSDRTFPPLITGKSENEIREKVNAVLNSFPAVVSIASEKPDGESALLANPDRITKNERKKMVGRRESLRRKGVKANLGLIEARLIHLTHIDAHLKEHGKILFSPEKSAWVPRIIPTLQFADARVKLTNGRIAFVKKYEEGIHAVVLDSRGAVVQQLGADRGLITAYALAPRVGLGVLGGTVENQRPPHSAHPAEGDYLEEARSPDSAHGATWSLDPNPATANSVAALRALPGYNIADKNGAVKAEPEKTEENQRPPLVASPSAGDYLKEAQSPDTTSEAAWPLGPNLATANSVAALRALLDYNITIENEIVKPEENENAEYQSRPVPKEVEQARLALEQAQKRADEAGAKLAAISQKYELADEMGRLTPELKAGFAAARQAAEEADIARIAAQRDYIDKLDAAENAPAGGAEAAGSPAVDAAETALAQARKELDEANKKLIAAMDELESYSRSGGATAEANARFEACSKQSGLGL